MTTRDYVRRIAISKNSECHINEILLENPQLSRGHVVIIHGREERRIEAIWIQRKKRSFILAAKDLPEDLDAIEAMIPLPVTLVDGEHKIKGVV